MNQYSADLGYWEVGQVYKFEAKDDDEACRKAGDRIKELRADNKVDEYAHVVQVHKVVNGRRICIYDYMNGLYKETVNH